jgi:hypothetical protein
MTQETLGIIHTIADFTGPWKGESRPLGTIVHALTLSTLDHIPYDLKYPRGCCQPRTSTSQVASEVRQLQRRHRRSSPSFRAV